MDIVVPGRKSKATLPPQQAWLESRANHRATNIMRGQDPETQSSEPDMDLWFGPKVFNRAGADYFSKYRSKLDKCDSIIKPVIDASRGGLRVMDVEVDFTYPSPQSEQEMNDREFARKRAIQYGTILVELGDKFWQTHKLDRGGVKKKEDSK